MTSDPIPTIELERQPEPQPPDQIPTATPSLLLYGLLLLVAIGMVLVAFGVVDTDWRGFMLNLATEVIGAVIILILVDRRLRQSEVNKIAQYRETLVAVFERLLSKDERAAAMYAKAILQALEDIRPRPFFEHRVLRDLYKKANEGFVLIGPPGVGKTTLVQAFASQLAKDALRRSAKRRLPVFLLARSWKSSEDLEQTLFSETSKFAKLNRDTFRKWLGSGKIVVMVDGMDEAEDRFGLISAIGSLMCRYPTLLVSATSRQWPGLELHLAEHGFPARVTVSFDPRSWESMFRESFREFVEYMRQKSAGQQ